MTRAGQLRRVDDLVAGARASRSGALVVMGEPGVGKSWLCGRAGDAASGFRVVRACGVESESHLGYAGLLDILSPLLDEGAFERLAPARADALRGALRLDGPAMPDPLAVAVACLDVLADAATRSPLLVVVDDAHWVDGSSLAALRFVARRLNADRVALLFAVRPGAAPGVLPGAETLELGPLSDADASELLAELAGLEVDGEVARRLVAATAGNALALRRAAQDLSGEQLTGRASLPSALPVGAGYERLAAGVPVDTRQALALLAIGETAPEGVFDLALVELGLTPASFAPAVAVGLVRVDGGRPRFEHPLVRTAVWNAAARPVRRLAHGAIAAAWSDAGDGERTAWHRAAAAEGVDAGGSLAMAGAARSARARGAPETAAQAWRRAAELQPDPGEGLGLRLEEACDLARGGRAVELLALTDGILVEGEPPAVLRADFEMLRGHALVWQGQISDAAQLFADAAARIRSTDVGRAVKLMAGTAFALATCGDVRGAVDAARSAAELTEGAGGAAEASARATLGWALILAGDGRDGYPLLLASQDQTSDDDGVLSLLAPLAPARLGQFACWMEDYGTARRELERSVARTREAGALSDLPHALGALAELEFRLGDWTSSRNHAEEAVRLGEDIGQHFHYAHVGLAQLEAVTGDAGAARAHVDHALALDPHSTSESLRVYTSAALGLLELTLDHPERAAAHLHETRARAERAGLAEPNIVQWTGDLIESQCRAGQDGEAARTLASFERQAERTGRRWALAAAARGRVLLAPAGDLDDASAEAARRAADVPSPFERARTTLCLGERLRRDGRRVEARARLHEALEAFDSIGAAPWAEKARRELRSSGAHPRRGARIGGDAMTPQEAQISALVAEGRTNKDIAGALFLSPKTVEFHLGHVYRKLGVSNRTQLARTLLLAGSPADER